MKAETKWLIFSFNPPEVLNQNSTPVYCWATFFLGEYQLVM